MNHSPQKELLVRLGNGEYEELRRRVLQRDSWRCQHCGSMTNLAVHHRQFRSHSGVDIEDNLITLCADCHSSLHCHWGVRSRRQTRAFTAPRRPDFK